MMFAGQARNSCASGSTVAVIIAQDSGVILGGALPVVAHLLLQDRFIHA